MFNEHLTDIYILTERIEDSFYYPNLMPAYSDYKQFIHTVIEKSKLVLKKDYVIASDCGVRFRCHRMPSQWGQIIIMRRLPDVAWTLNDCKFTPELQQHLLSPRLNSGGIIIVGGMPGNGKSTTCGGIIIDRLAKHGGHCNTIEDPVEMPLMGRHGNGFCIQREVDGQEHFHEAIRDTMRGYPVGVNTMMMIGEVRDPDTAELALRSSIDGRLVIVSFHSGDIVQSIQRLVSLASDKLGNRETRDMLASSFRMALHQQLIDGKLSVSSLLDTQHVIGTIRMENAILEQLQTEIRRQDALLKSRKRVEVREK